MVGSCLEQSANRANLGGRGKKPSHKCKGDDNSSKSTDHVPQNKSCKDSSFKNRQLSSTELSSENGENKKRGSYPVSERNMAFSFERF